MTKIRILEPPGSTPETNGTILIKEEVPADVLKESKPSISRKRPFDCDSFAHEAEEQRPRKKARIDNTHALVFPELYVTGSTALGGSVLKKKKNPDIVPRFSVFNFPKPTKKKAAGVAVSQRFLSQIRQTTPAGDIS